MGGKLEKAIRRLKTEPKDYSFTEAKALLKGLGFREDSKGKTSGSRVRFHKDSMFINLHKPHPGDEMKLYAVKALRKYLEEMGEI